jgi:GntR family transcriptional repressor for pyruvate dehydrogenase complex
MSSGTTGGAPSDALGVEHFLTPPPRPRLYEEVARRIIVFIQGLHLQPGARLPSERELAHRLSVSRTSVRQAVVALSTRGVIDVRQGDGMYVREVPPHEAPASTLGLPDTDISDAREALEVKLAELAAIRRTADDLEAMEGSIDAMATDIETGGMGDDPAREFHAAVTRAARSSVLARLMTTLSTEFHTARVISLAHPDRPRRSLEHHRLIVRAIRDGDPDAASQAMRLHLRVMADLSAAESRLADGADS